MAITNLTENMLQDVVSIRYLMTVTVSEDAQSVSIYIEDNGNKIARSFLKRPPSLTFFSSNNQEAYMRVREILSNYALYLVDLEVMLNGDKR